MTFFSPLSNYLYQKNPAFYGGKQEEYLQLAEQTIKNGVEKIRVRSAAHEDLTTIFFDLLRDFRVERKEIAIRHGTNNCYQFGEFRVDSPYAKNCYMMTGLYSQYDGYNEIFMGQFAPILNRMKHDLKGFKEKKSSEEETVLDRKVKFDVEVYDATDLASLSKIDPQDVQKKLGTEKSFLEIQVDFSLMKRVKTEFSDLYKKISFLTFYHQIQKDFPSPRIISFEKGLSEGDTNNLKNIWAVGTLRLEIQGRLYALSKYITWLYTNYHEDPVERMKRCSKVYVIHQDVFLIEETLQEVGRLFARAIQWNKETESVQELKNRVALFRFVYSHCMPSARGDGAIGDWLELTIYLYHHFIKTHFSQDKLPCFETLASISLSRYLKNYDSITIVE